MGHNADKNAAALETIKAYSVNASAHVCNVADEANVAACFEATLAAHGALMLCQCRRWGAS